MADLLFFLFSGLSLEGFLLDFTFFGLFVGGGPIIFLSLVAPFRPPSWGSRGLSVLPYGAFRGLSGPSLGPSGSFRRTPMGPSGAKGNPWESTASCGSRQARSEPPSPQGRRSWPSCPEPDSSHLKCFSCFCSLLCFFVFW